MTTIEKIKAEIERLIAMNKTRNGFPAGTMCAVRIEAYENLLSFLDTLEPVTDCHTLEESEKPVPNDLEEAAEKWVFENCFDCDIVGEHRANDAFIAGAKWQKEQMMKEAVEWTVTTNLANRPVIYLDQLKGFQYGDKVRIIILKEK